MTREEQIIQASVAYNEQRGKLNVIGGSAILSDEEFIIFNKNPDFIEGAKWADKTMIDKTCEWLEENLIYYWGQVCSDDSDFVETFRKEMEE